MPGEDDELAARAKERLGSVLKGKYRLDGVLGIGGMATVYAATHQRNHDRVAVKILHPEISVDKTLRERFLREGYAANSVGHPGTVRVIDDDVAKDGTVFLVMDLLQGETLETRRERMRRLSVAEVVPLMIELLNILAAAHAKLITHRDLKPENLFFTTDGKLKLLDFGVARLREASPARTKSGAIFGTPAYMPPEQALGRVKEVDALSDVWAVGATAFTLISGRYVHDAQTAEEMLVYSATRSAPLLASVAAQVPTEIAAVIDRALTFEKKDRWQSAREMHEALVRASASSTARAHDYNDNDDDKTALLAMPQMTLPPVVPGAATVEMATEVSRRVRSVVKASTIGGLATTGKQTNRKLSRTLVAGATGGALFLVLVGLIVALVVLRARARQEEPLTAASWMSAAMGSVAVVGSSPPIVPTASASAAPLSIPADALPKVPPISGLAAGAPTSPSTRLPARPPAAPAPPNPYCTPPFEDVGGVRKWKRGCL